MPASSSVFLLRTASVSPACLPPLSCIAIGTLLIALWTKTKAKYLGKKINILVHYCTFRYWFSILFYSLNLEKPCLWERSHHQKELLNKCFFKHALFLCLSFARCLWLWHAIGRCQSGCPTPSLRSNSSRPQDLLVARNILCCCTHFVMKTKKWKMEPPYGLSWIQN